jgi:CBS-domain-containing membrane protein
MKRANLALPIAVLCLGTAAVLLAAHPASPVALPKPDALRARD